MPRRALALKTVCKLRWIIYDAKAEKAIETSKDAEDIEEHVMAAKDELFKSAE